MHVFYIPELSPAHAEITLSEEESKHACKVLRLKNGDQIALLDGRGGDYTGEITEDHPKHCQVKILTHTLQDAPKHEIHIAIAPTKNNDRIEWFLEKTTELGITEITLLLCKNSERRQSREDRFEKILVSAMKQSQRKFLPRLNALTPFPEFLKKYPQGALAHCADGAKNGLHTTFQAQNYPILIGPEGDFTAEEIAAAQQSGYDFITLGQNRLRTETAGLYACMLALQEIQ